MPDQPVKINFDPFSIGPDHAQHSHLTQIVRLEESGRIFCPLCLESMPLSELNKVDDKIFKQYIDNLFEAIDQHSEINKLRKIILTTLEIFLARRSFHINDDSEFHNLLRIIYKIMKSDLFDFLEYPMMVKVFSVILSHHARDNPIPIAPVWTLMEFILDYAKNNLPMFKIENIHRDKNEEFRFIGASALMIKTYLATIRRFSIDRVADLIFPLAENASLAHSRRYYTESQAKCLDFMSNRLLPHCWPHIEKLEQPLGFFGKKLVAKLVDALTECFSASIQSKNKDFLKYISGLDCFNTAHLLIYRNNGDFRQPVRSFLRSLVFYYAEEYFGKEAEFKKYLDSNDSVETNHKNAIAVCTDESRYKKTAFYILINSIAIKQSSKYYNSTRLRKVIKSVDPSTLDLNHSRVLMRAYLFTAASVMPKLHSSDNVERFIRGTWRRMLERHTDYEFEEQFCFDSKIVLWVHEHPTFINLITVDSFKYVLEKSLENGTVLNVLQHLIKNTFYRNLFYEFIKDDESAASVVEEVVKQEESTSKGATSSNHFELLSSQISSGVFARFHTAMLESINNARESNHRQIHRIARIIVILANSKNFRFATDYQYIEDMFKYAEILYKLNINQKVDDILEQLNEFLMILIRTNSHCLMRILKKLNSYILGLMCDRLADYTIGDSLCESIAELLVVYDELDYPLDMDVIGCLQPMFESIMNWSFSKNSYLHILAIMLAQRVYDADMSARTKACITTGLIHILFTNSEIFNNKIICRVFLTLVDHIKCNPLIDQLVRVGPGHILEEFKEELREMEDERPPSPISVIFSDDRSCCEDEHISVANILNLLHDQDVQLTDRIPTNLLVTEGIMDQHTNSGDTEHWEQLAVDITRNVADTH